jgi:hypothetical protein
MMTHLVDGSINWLNVINMGVCITAALALWMTVLLQQHSRLPLPRWFQASLLVLAVTYALSATGMLASWAGVAGAPVDRATLSMAQWCWMARNIVIAGMAVCGAVTTWRLSRPEAANLYEVNQYVCVTKGKSAAQIPVMAVAER